METEGASLCDARGAVMVELATTVAVYLLLTVTGLEFMMFCHYTLSIQAAVNFAAREATIGTCNGGECSAADRAEALRDRVVQKARSFGVGLSRDDVCVKPQSAVDCSVHDAGGPREFIEIIATRPYNSLFLPNLRVSIPHRAIGRNEPFIL